VYFVRFLILHFILSLPVTVAIAAEDSGQSWSPRDENLRILEMHVEQYRLEDVLATYQHKNILLVPLGALSEILDNRDFPSARKQAGELITFPIHSLVSNNDLDRMQWI